MRSLFRGLVLLFDAEVTLLALVTGCIALAVLGYVVD